MSRTVIFYSPLGKNLSPDKIGGIESASQRTIQILTDSGFRVIPLGKPVLEKRVSVYLIQLFSTWIKLMVLLLKNSDAVLHIVGVYRKLMYVEWAFTLSAKILGHKTVYDIRNGDMIKEYDRRNILYKRGMLSLLKHSDSILCQGSDYMRFIGKKLSRTSLYYPNYLQDCFLAGQYPKRDMKQCRLVYFGQITPPKNIDVILEIYRSLYNRGIATTLDLIGLCPDSYKNYREKLEIKMHGPGFPYKQVRFWGMRKFNDFFPYLHTCHFFLFPSNEVREGHSNALTEAMGCGIVPIVSNAGFNREVVGDDRLVVTCFDAAQYADVIYDIWANNQWESYSREMYLRVIGHFSEKSVKHTLLEAYR